jgi:transcriptional regulator with XRE-family HTH domain
MTVTKKDALSRYIRRVMDQRGFRIRDVEIRAAGDITESYIGEILRGSASNPSVSKLKALARGLGVDPAELFRVAAGMEESAPVLLGNTAVSYSLMVLDAMRRIIASPELSELVSEVVCLSHDDIAIAYRSIKSLNDARERDERTQEVV